MRPDGRQPDALREVEIVRGFTDAPPGAVLIRTGRTKVLCTASIEESVPAWRESSGAGWITAEYDMLPGATEVRRPRSRLRVDGRSAEIQRLIGRALRAVARLERLGPRTIVLDCDVLQADGGTRTAAVTGAYVALADAVAVGQQRGLWGGEVLAAGVAAVSVARVDGVWLLDPDYREDAAAAVDCNLVLTTQGAWVEVQATAEQAPYSDADLAEALALGRRGIGRLFDVQRAALAGPRADGS